MCYYTYVSFFVPVGDGPVRFSASSIYIVFYPTLLTGFRIFQECNWLSNISTSKQQ